MKKISLFGNNPENKQAIVDDIDYHLVSKYRWLFIEHGRHSKSHYAITKINKKTTYMHRLIMNAEKNNVVDHIDRNGLNNQRANLRVGSASDNQHNRTSANPNKSSKYKGVSWIRNMGKWGAQICLNYDARLLGYFSTEKEAAKAYDKEAKKLFGEFAVLNFTN